MLKKLKDRVILTNIYYEKLNLTKSMLADFSKHTLELKLAILKKLVLHYYKFELHDEQLLTILALQNGYMTEVKTGEGKSICIALSAILDRSNGNHVYVVTTNNYLAKRDYEKFTPLIECVGYTSEFNKHISDLDELECKEGIHVQDIVYTDTSELCFDYLRSRIAFSNYMKLDSVIIDEADFVLIDNATTVCNISDGNGEVDYKYVFYMNMFFSVIDNLSYTEVPCYENVSYELWDVDLVVLKSSKNVIITEVGLKHIGELLNCNIQDDIHLQYICMRCCEAKYCYEESVDYAIIDGEVWCINQNNGRVSVGSSYEIDIQNAIEIKHKLSPSLPRGKEESISYQTFFSKFKSLKGLSGTLMDAKDELQDLFRVQTVEIPTHKPCVRVDVPTVYFRNCKEKYTFLVHLIQNKIPNRLPKLIVCENEIEVAKVCTLLEENGIHSTSITNCNIKEEEELISKAGKSGAITVSTSLVGRGTDIILDEDVRDEGLVVIATCHFENKRIDLQVRGRSGRQGNRGIAYTLSALDDKVWDTVKLDEKAKLLNVDKQTFYGNKYQQLLNDKLLNVQIARYSTQHTLRKYNFISSNVVELYKDKVLNLDKESFSNIDAILNHKYSSNSQVADSEVMELQIDDWISGDIDFDLDRLDTYSKIQIYNFYEKALNEMMDYSRNTYARGAMDTYLGRLSEVCKDLYMHTTKRFLFQFLTRSCVDE